MTAYNWVKAWHPRSTEYATHSGSGRRCEKRRYHERDPHVVFAEWQQTREDFLSCLATIPDDCWHREGKPPECVAFSLNAQLFMACWHDPLHIEQMTRILTEKN
jgi:hypothetical protein